MQTSEFTGLQRRVETLEDELRFALKRLTQMEIKLAEEDAMVKRLERDVQQTQFPCSRRWSPRPSRDEPLQHLRIRAAAASGCRGSTIAFASAGLTWGRCWLRDLLLIDVGAPLLRLLLRLLSGFRLRSGRSCIVWRVGQHGRP